MNFDMLACVRNQDQATHFLPVFNFSVASSLLWSFQMTIECMTTIDDDDDCFWTLICWKGDEKQKRKIFLMLQKV